jgi:hypothetical protein
LTTVFGFVKKSNGHKVALAFGGSLLNEDTADSLAQKQALNIVTEQAIGNMPYFMGNHTRQFITVEIVQCSLCNSNYGTFARFSSRKRIDTLLWNKI